MVSIMSWHPNFGPEKRIGPNISQISIDIFFHLDLIRKTKFYNIFDFLQQRFLDTFSKKYG